MAAVDTTAAVLTPEQVIAGIADLLDQDAEVADDLRQIATCGRTAAGSGLLGLPAGWPERERDRLVADLLDRIAPNYAPITTDSKGAAQ